MAMDSKSREDRAKELAQGYTRGKRALEIFSITSFLVLTSVAIAQIFPFLNSVGIVGCVSAFILGYVLSDFVSGLVHWAADTWGSVSWPIVGNTLIRSFREHHVDPKAITRHDFIETNGDNCLVCLPILIFIVSYGATEAWEVFLAIVLLSLLIWTFITNQIHKWAHEDKVSGWVRFFQKAGLFISKEHHEKHHQFPHMSHYCITSGWLNAPLMKVSFYRIAERVVTKVTGMLPRSEDLKNLK